MKGTSDQQTKKKVDVENNKSKEEELKKKKVVMRSYKISYFSKAIKMRVKEKNEKY